MTPTHPDDLVNDLDQPETITQVLREDGVVQWTGSFWTHKQRQGHSLHEISYRACFKPELPRHFLTRLSRPGDIVFDPFMGRGTTPLEAALMGRTPWGNDINPISERLLRGRLNTPPIDAVHERLHSFDLHRPRKTLTPDLDMFFHPETLTQIENLKNRLRQKREDNTFDTVDAWIETVTLNRLTGHSSGYLSGRTLPPNQAASRVSQRKINAKLGQTPPPRDLLNIVLTKSRSLLRDGGLSTPHARLFQDHSTRLDGLPPGQVDLVITSPPFLDVVNYAQDNWLRAWFCDIDLDTVPITTPRKLDDWILFTRQTLQACAWAVKPGGHLVWEVGEVRKGKILLEDAVLEAAKPLALRPVCVLLHTQTFTKTAQCWGIDNNARGTNSQRMVVFQRL